MAGGIAQGMMDFATLQQTEAQTADTRARLPLIQAQTQEAQQHVQKQQMDLQMMQKQAAMLAQAGAARASGQPTDPADKLMQLGQQYLDAGLVKQGGEIINQAAEIRARQAQAIHSQTLVANEQATRKDKDLGQLEGMLASANDPASWNAAKVMWLQQHPGEQSPWVNLPFTEENRNLVLRGTQEGREVLAKDTQERSEKALEDLRKAQEANLADEKRHRLEVEKIERDRLKKGEKVGQPVGLPPKDFQKQALLQIKKTFKGLPDDEAQTAAFAIASRAMSLRKSNPGLDADEALQQAIIAETPNFQQKQERSGLMSFLAGIAPEGVANYEKSHPDGAGMITHYTRGGEGAVGGKVAAGASPDRPLPPPATQDAFVVGQYYTIKGKTVKYIGNGQVEAAE